MRQEGSLDIGDTLSLTHIVSSAFETPEGNVVDALFAIAKGLNRIAETVDDRLRDIYISIDHLADVIEADKEEDRR